MKTGGLNGRPEKLPDVSFKSEIEAVELIILCTQSASAYQVFRDIENDQLVLGPCVSVDFFAWLSSFCLLKYPCKRDMFCRWMDCKLMILLCKFI